MRRFLLIAAALLLVLVAYISIEQILYRGAFPPESFQALRAYLEWDPSANQFVQLEGAPPHLMALGPFTSLTPSGPSAHVFDVSGNLVDSAADLGDDPAFGKRWGVRYPLNIEGRPLAEQWLELRDAASRSEPGTDNLGGGQ